MLGRAAYAQTCKANNRDIPIVMAAGLEYRMRALKDPLCEFKRFLSASMMEVAL